MVYIADMTILMSNLTTLTMTKYLENLRRDSTLPFITIAKKFDYPRQS